VVNVEHRQRCPGGVVRSGGPLLLLRLFAEGRVRLERELQVQDVVYDVLEDLHFADFLILRYRGHEALQAAVAVVHVAVRHAVVQVLLLHPAACDVEAVVRQTVQREIAAAAVSVAAAAAAAAAAVVTRGAGVLLRADGSNRLHFFSFFFGCTITTHNKPSERFSELRIPRGNRRKKYDSLTTVGDTNYNNRKTGL